MRGFAGSHLARTILQNTDWEVLSLERLSAKTSGIDREGKATIGTLPDRLADIPADRIQRFYHDFRAPLQDSLLADIGHVDYVIHNGAEVHAIRSLTDPRSFVQSNTVGAFNMLEAARKLKVRKFIFTSSAEVFGPAAPNEYHDEDAPLNPSNPYSAAKAGAEMLCRSYFKSFHVPVNIVRTMNMFGPMQDVTKFVPMVIKKAMMGETLKVDTRGNHQIGERQWIPISDYVDALLFILENGKAGEAYNVSGTEMNNLGVAEQVDFYTRPEYRVKTEFVEAPATHDMRYAINDFKLRSLGWAGSGEVALDLYFKNTVQWYLEHPEWLT